LQIYRLTFPNQEKGRSDLFIYRQISHVNIKYQIKYKINTTRPEKKVRDEGRRDHWKIQRDLREGKSDYLLMSFGITLSSVSLREQEGNW
jgi:hypothetical protein